MLKTRLKSCGVIYITFGKSYWLGWKHIKPSNQGRGWIRVSIMLVVRMSCPRWIAFSDYHIKLSNAVNKLRPRPHVYVFMRKRRLFCSFSSSVPHANAYSAFSKVFVFTESGDFRKRVWKWRLSKTETFENGVDLKTYTCGRSHLPKPVNFKTSGIQSS